jgi:Protein of unknown function (DUF2975)
MPSPSVLRSGSTFPALPAARRLLTALLYVNVVYGLGILGLLLASIVVPGPLFEALGVQPAAGRDTLERGMRLIMVIGLVSVPVAYVILSRLRAIVDTVRDSDPFVAANADRLQTIAWAYLGLELLHIAVGVVAASSSSSAQPLDVHWHFSVTPWVAVLLLFVLARVFDHGARMRADLEGTV